MEKSETKEKPSQVLEKTEAFDTVHHTVGFFSQLRIFGKPIRGTSVAEWSPVDFRGRCRAYSYRGRDHKPSHLNATEDDILEAKELAASMSLEHVRRVSHRHERGIFKLSSDIVE
ncbi:hypothetical protein E5D57_006654 [Metarhizium anisopliae]|nr:hypothetical protein E5D57_006654 [Metarhizium anisopliae]